MNWTAIVEFFDKHVDTPGWIRRSATLAGNVVMDVEVEFCESDPRYFKIISCDRFATLHKVRIYEVTRAVEMLGGRRLSRVFGTLVYGDDEPIRCDWHEEA